ncbi:MAG TPA: serine hydrolase [Elusimicrobia bacterium]|nr:serine hydrolase [Elusimicrobiota bacterium]
MFSHISAADLAGVLSNIYKANGRVTSAVFVSSDTAYSGHFMLETEKGYRVPAAISLNPLTDRVNGIFFGLAYKKDQTLTEARMALVALPGKTGLLVLHLGKNPETIEALNENSHFAVGSAFKLYVLGALLEKKVPWEKIFRLKEEDRSLPSGSLQGWPDGAPVTAHTLAAMMISESDNTAADALISRVGRRNIEAALPALGHSNPALLRPFLKTSEMFRLKADNAAALKYISLPPEEKYGFLEDLRAIRLSAAALRPSPFGLDKIEWPASPADLCRVMKYFSDKDDKAALDILAMNPGLHMPEGGFLYAGYKGGSQPGVFSTTWLLKNKKGEWFCLSAAWNDEKDALEEGKFLEIMQGAVTALAAQ